MVQWETVFSSPQDTELQFSPERPLELTLRPDRGDRAELVLRIPTEDDTATWREAMETSITGSRL